MITQEELVALSHLTARSPMTPAERLWVRQLFGRLEAGLSQDDKGIDMQRQSGRGAVLLTIPTTGSDAIPDGECYAVNCSDACTVDGVFANGTPCTAYPLQAGHNPMGFRSISAISGVGTIWAVYL